MLRLSEQVQASVPIPTRTPRVQQSAGRREAVPEPRVGAGVVGDRRPRVPEAAHVVTVEPHRVRGGEVRAEHPERIEPRGLRPAVEAHPGEGLHLRFREMGMESHLVLGGEPQRGPQERLAAMVGNGRGEGEPHPVLVERPCRPRPLPGGEAGLEGFERDRFRLAPEIGGKRVEQARNRPVERAVGHHRGHHRAHSRVLVGPPDRLQSLGGRRGKLEVQIVGCRASLPHHLHRPDEGGQVLVLQGAAAGEPRRRIEQQLQGPAVAEALREVVVAVGVRVDEARHEQPAGRVHRRRVRGRGHPRRPDLAHRVPLDQEVGRLRRVPGGVEQAPAPDDRRVHGGSPRLVAWLPRRMAVSLRKGARVGIRGDHTRALRRWPSRRSPPNRERRCVR